MPLARGHVLAVADPEPSLAARLLDRVHLATRADPRASALSVAEVREVEGLLGPEVAADVALAAQAAGRAQDPPMHALHQAGRAHRAAGGREAHGQRRQL